MQRSYWPTVAAAWCWAGRTTAQKVADATNISCAAPDADFIYNRLLAPLIPEDIYLAPACLFVPSQQHQDEQPALETVGKSFGALSAPCHSPIHSTHTAHQNLAIKASRGGKQSRPSSPIYMYAIRSCFFFYSFAAGLFCVCVSFFLSFCYRQNFHVRNIY